MVHVSRAVYLPVLPESPGQRYADSKGVLRMRAYNGYSEKDRRRAQAWLNSQWQSGLLERPAQCVACRQDKGIIDAHAEDYSKPFTAGKTDRYHLCFTCHMMVHSRFQSARDWQWYKEVIRQGGRYAPVSNRSIGRFRAKHIGKRPPPDYLGTPPVNLVLEVIDGSQIPDLAKRR